MNPPPGFLDGGNQNVFNNFFADTGNEIRDIYNDSSGTNNNSANNNSLNAISMKAKGTANASQDTSNESVF